MKKDDFFEMLNFNTGKKINISKELDDEYSTLAHWHPFIEILVNLNDENRITINFNEYTLHTNDIVIIHPGDLHTIYHTDKKSFYIIQFPENLVSIMTDFNNLSSVLHQYHIIPYHPSNMECSRMIYLIKKLVALHSENHLFNEVRIYTLLLEFYILFAQYCLNMKKDEICDDDSMKYSSTDLIVEACLYISQNCSSDLTLEDTAHHIGISKSYFAHLFKKYTNMTFIDFLTMERIKKAETLISNPNIKIIDVAFESGFSSVSSFNRAFKKIKKISPSEFRFTQITVKN